MKPISKQTEPRSSLSLNRRSFLYTALTGAGGATQVLRGADSPAADRFREPEHELPMRDDADVIVCGGGPAGVAAALTAARAGARPRLFETNGCLGGVWTAGLLTYIFDFDKPGLTAELKRKLDERDARRQKNPGRFVYEPEAMKLLLEEMCGTAGVKTLLHARVAAAYRDGNRLATVVDEFSQAAVPAAVASAADRRAQPEQGPDDDRRHRQPHECRGGERIDACILIGQRRRGQLALVVEPDAHLVASPHRPVDLGRGVVHAAAGGPPNGCEKRRGRRVDFGRVDGTVVERGGLDGVTMGGLDGDLARTDGVAQVTDAQGRIGGGHQ